MDWHKALLQSMMRSRFCMIVPGDSQSSERLTDAFVSGAIATCVPTVPGRCCVERLIPLMSSSRLHLSSLEAHEIDAGLPFTLYASVSGEYSVR